MRHYIHQFLQQRADSCSLNYVSPVQFEANRFGKNVRFSGNITPAIVTFLRFAAKWPTASAAGAWRYGGCGFF